MFSFPQFRKSHNEFIRGYSEYWGFKSELVDAKSAPSVVIRLKEGTDARAPPEVISVYKAPVTTARVMAMPAAETMAEFGSSGESGDSTIPMNALMVSSVVQGIDTKTLEILLEPVFAFVNVQTMIQWIGDGDDALVFVSGPGKDVIAIEEVLRSKEGEVKSKLIEAGVCGAVEGVWVKRDGDILKEARDEKKESRKRLGRAGLVQSRKQVETVNMFSVLDRVGGGTENTKATDWWDESPAPAKTSSSPLALPPGLGPKASTDVKAAEAVITLEPDSAVVDAWEDLDES